MSVFSVGNPSAAREKKSSLPVRLRERILLHQVHPVKLVVDWGTGFAAAWLFWDKEIVAALLVGLVPSVIVSAYMISRTDLTRYRDTPLGRYFLSSRTRPNDQVRLAGLVIMWGGAWANSIPVAAAGLAVILLAWGKGLLVKEKGDTPRVP